MESGSNYESGDGTALFYNDALRAIAVSMLSDATSFGDGGTVTPEISKEDIMRALAENPPRSISGVERLEERIDELEAQVQYLMRDNARLGMAIAQLQEQHTEKPS